MEGGFLARRRHLQALDKRRNIYNRVKRNCWEPGLAIAGGRVTPGAAELKRNHRGITSDDLLGRIFSSFCIGK